SPPRPAQGESTRFGSVEHLAGDQPRPVLRPTAARGTRVASGPPVAGRPPVPLLPRIALRDRDTEPRSHHLAGDHVTRGGPAASNPGGYRHRRSGSAAGEVDRLAHLEQPR